MKQSEQARMFIGLAIPGSGPVAAPRGQGSSERRSFALRWMLTRAQSWSRRHGIDGFQVAHFCALLGCGVLFGLFVGVYVGYMDAVTQPAGSPYSIGQMATSDVQWTAMMSQNSALHRPVDSAAERVHQPFWQRLAGGAAVARGVRNIRLDTPGLRSVKKAVVAR